MKTTERSQHKIFKLTVRRPAAVEECAETAGRGRADLDARSSPKLSLNLGLFHSGKETIPNQASRGLKIQQISEARSRLYPSNFLQENVRNILSDLEE